MSKFIDFRDLGLTPSGKTRRWDVVAKEHQTVIGWVQWDTGWRRYVFAPASQRTIFEQDCLRDIATFIEQQTREHKAARAARTEAKS